MEERGREPRMAVSFLSAFVPSASRKFFKAIGVIWIAYRVGVFNELKVGQSHTLVIPIYVLRFHSEHCAWNLGASERPLV
jgi:hypothetical protein